MMIIAIALHCSLLDYKSAGDVDKVSDYYHTRPSSMLDHHLRVRVGEQVVELAAAFQGQRDTRRSESRSSHTFLPYPLA
jgi:hypothetical protein